MEASTAAHEGQVLVLFKIRYSPTLDVDEMVRLNDRMHEIATPETGLLATESWAAEDGTYPTTYRFASVDAMHAFVRHPEHRALMRRGGDFFASLETQVTHIARTRVNAFAARAG